MFHPAASDSDSDYSASGSDSSSETSSVGVGHEHHDRQMEALDQWRTQSIAWIKEGPTAPLVERHSLPPIARTTDIPIELRANDIKRHIINIDSQFRDDPIGSTASNFYFSLLDPVKNVMRIRITSVEFPNNYAFFTCLRHNVSFQIKYGAAFASTFNVVIQTGNYSACDMETTLNAIFTTGLPWLSTVFNPITGRFTFTGTGAGSSAFKIDTTYGAYNQPFAYGLGFYLGFTYGVHASTTGTPFTLTSDICSNFAGDNYVFLKVNDYECVRQTTGDNDFVALAKVVLREPKNYMSFDDYASQHIKEVVFPNPVDVIRFKIELVDPYGRPVDMCSANISFSLEVLEVKNRTLYDRVRDSIMMRYI